VRRAHWPDQGRQVRRGRREADARDAGQGAGVHQRDGDGRHQAGAHIAAQGVRYGGRQKGSTNLVTREVRSLAAAHGEEAIKKIVVLMSSANPSVALAACKEILDRGFGKAMQPLKPERSTGAYDISRLTDEQLRLGYEIARAAATGLGDTD
jgi:hypothetical protein